MHDFQSSPELGFEPRPPSTECHLLIATCPLAQMILYVRCSWLAGVGIRTRTIEHRMTLSTFFPYIVIIKKDYSHSSNSTRESQNNFVYSREGFNFSCILTFNIKILYPLVHLSALKVYFSKYAG